MLSDYQSHKDAKHKNSQKFNWTKNITENKQSKI